MASRTSKSTSEDEKSALKSSESASKRVRPVLFHYPSLPKWEIRLYFLILIGTLAWGWYTIIDLSLNITKLNVHSFGQWIWTTHPVFGRRIKDTTNFEWTQYTEISFRLLPALLLHSVFFNGVDWILDDQKHLAKQLVRTVAGLAISCHVFGTMEVALTIIFGSFTFLVTRCTNSKVCLWMSTLPCLYSALHSPMFTPANEFTSLLLSSYKMLAYISYNYEYLSGYRLEKVDSTSTSRPLKCHLLDLLRMFHYVFYMPFGCAVIVLYPDFERQLTERHLQKRSVKEFVWRAARLAFWWLLADTVLHFAYFEAFLHSPEFLRRMRQDQLTALGCAVGQFFHLKYVVIFGVPRLFAWLDAMQPPDGPICVTRVALYAQIWRQFDRGLYSFFKQYIFLPICRPTFSITRKICGVLVAYGFVLFWHGHEWHNIVWIVVNVVELFLESGARGIYSLQSVRTWRENHLSDRNFRRWIAFWLWVPFAFALYSNFYFLAGKEAGWIFVERIFIGETITLQYPFFLLISLGYAYAHVCMEAEQWMYERALVKEKVKSS